MNYNNNKINFLISIIILARKKKEEENEFIFKGFLYTSYIW